jgi:hypothetical protein
MLASATIGIAARYAVDRVRIASINAEYTENLTTELSASVVVMD